MTMFPFPILLGDRMGAPLHVKHFYFLAERLQLLYHDLKTLQDKQRVFILLKNRPGCCGHRLIDSLRRFQDHRP